jgi:prepilin-type N-terminal cleavage/methylation domain-containing protein
MNSMNKFKKGFTLIELLIVITIIGVLSTVILTSVSNSRARAYDSKIKQQLTSFRTAAEMYFNNQIPNSYNTTGSTINICSAGMFNDVSPTNGSPGSYIDPANLPSFTQVYCDATDSAYAVKATLYSGTDYWCVDNKGSSRSIHGTPADDTLCP